MSILVIICRISSAICGPCCGSFRLLRARGYFSSRSSRTDWKVTFLKSYISCIPPSVHFVILKLRASATHTSASEQEVTSESLKEVIVALEEDPVSGQGTCESYVRRLCRSGDISDVIHLLSNLRRKKIFLSPHIYKLLLAFAAETKNFELSSWVFKDLLLTTDSQDFSSFTNVALAYQNSNLDSLHKLIKGISDSTFPRSPTVINRILVAFAKTGQAEKAILIFEDMKNLKCKPDVVTYNTILDILGKMERVEEMLQEFNSMAQSGHVPDIVTYNTLINNLQRIGRMDLCSNLLRKMLERGILPDLRTYTALIDGFGRLGNVEVALRLFDEMKLRRIRPSVYVYRGLINYLKKVQKLELANALSEEMRVNLSRIVGPQDFKRKNG